MAEWSGARPREGSSLGGGTSFLLQSPMPIRGQLWIKRGQRSPGNFFWPSIRKFWGSLDDPKFGCFWLKFPWPNPRPIPWPAGRPNLRPAARTISLAKPQVESQGNPQADPRAKSHPQANLSTNPIPKPISVPIDAFRL